MTARLSSKLSQEVPATELALSADFLIVFAANLLPFGCHPNLCCFVQSRFAQLPSSFLPGFHRHSAHLPKIEHAIIIKDKATCRYGVL